MSSGLQLKNQYKRIKAWLRRTSIFKQNIRPQFLSMSFSVDHFLWVFFRWNSRLRTLQSSRKIPVVDAHSALNLPLSPVTKNSGQKLLKLFLAAQLRSRVIAIAWTNPNHMGNGWLSPFSPYVQLSLLLIYGTTSFFFSKGARLEVIWSYVWAFGKYGSYMELRFFWGSARVAVESYFFGVSTSGSMLVFGGICFFSFRRVNQHISMPTIQEHNF